MFITFFIYYTLFISRDFWKTNINNNFYPQLNMYYVDFGYIFRNTFTSIPQK